MHSKCFVLSLQRSRTRIQPTYRFGNYTLITTNKQRDLGVIIDSKLEFFDHVEWIILKTTSSQGFAKRVSRGISDEGPLKAIYSALVRSHLDYCSVVWCK